MGHMNIAMFLLQSGADPNYQTHRGETPLHLATRANQTDIIRVLLRHGAHVDAKAKVLSILTSLETSKLSEGRVAAGNQVCSCFYLCSHPDLVYTSCHTYSLAFRALALLVGRQE